MDHLYISFCGSFIPIPPFQRVRLGAISNILPHIPLLDKVGYLFFKLKIIFSVMPVISVKLTILIFISLSGINLDFSRPFDEFFVFDLSEHLGDEGVEVRQYQVGMVRWSVRAPVVSPP